MKTLVYLFCLLIFPVSLLSQEQETESYPKSSLLWEISGNNLEHRSYIFGTNHFFSSSLIDTSSVINSIIEQVEVVVPEVLINKVDSSGLYNMMLMGEDEYYSFSSKEEEDMLNSFIRKKTGMPSEFFLKFKPIIVYITLLFLDNQKKTGSKQKPGSDIIDNYFQLQAAKLNKELIPLEDAKFQISLLTEKIPIKDQLKILLSYSASDTVVQSSLSKLDSCYRAYDIECLMSNEVDNEKVRTFNKYVFDERNFNWMKTLPGIINTRSALIVVGAGHLPGKNGVLELLMGQGYSVKPVKFW